MILAGRRINDNMGTYVAQQIAQLMIQRRIQVKDSRILVMGLTFKENCPDVRNTKIVDVIKELEKFGAKVDVVRSRGPTLTRPSTSTACGPVKKPQARHLRRGGHGRGPRRVPQDGPRQGARARQARNHVLYDIKYVFKRG